MRISDWSSDVCSSDLGRQPQDRRGGGVHQGCRLPDQPAGAECQRRGGARRRGRQGLRRGGAGGAPSRPEDRRGGQKHRRPDRSEEHTSELQSLMRISYAVFCLKKKKQINKKQKNRQYTHIHTEQIMTNTCHKKNEK